MNRENSKWLALAIVLTAPLLSVIDVFIINVAIPSIKKGVHATDAEIQLVIAGYLLGYASFLITGSRAGDHFGRKRTFFWGMLAFTVISCLCGLSLNPLQLNVTRFLQGVSAAFMVPQSIAFIQVLFPDPKERAKAIGFFGLTLGLASIIGQVMGGYLSELHGIVAGWRLIFFINLPIGLVALWTTHRYLQETPKNKGHVFDYSGVVILTAALFALIYPLIQGREKGWPWWSIGLLVLSVIIFIAFWFDQRKKMERGAHPLIDLNLFHIRDFNIGLLAVLFHLMMHTSYLLISAVYFQNGLGLTPAMSGLYFVSPGLLFTVASLIASRQVVHHGKKIPLIGVALIMVSFLLQFRFFHPETGAWTIVFLMAIYGFGNGFAMASLLTITLRKVPREFAGAAAGVYSTFQQTASALGVSIIGGLFYFAAGSGHPNPARDFQHAFGVGLIAEIVCLLFVAGMLFLLPETVSVSRSAPALQHAVE
jgi:EmrB/QacA subfamily drug resistance transporter